MASTTTTTVFNFLLKNHKLVTIPLTFTTEQSLLEQFATALKDAGELQLPLTYIDVDGQPRLIRTATEISELIASGVRPFFFNATSVLTRIDGNDVEELDDQDAPEDEIQVVAEVECRPGKRGHHHRGGKDRHHGRSHSRGRHGSRGHSHKRHGKKGKEAVRSSSSSSSSSSSPSSSSSRSPSPAAKKSHRGQKGSIKPHGHGPHRPGKHCPHRRDRSSSTSSSSSSSRSRSPSKKRHHHGRHGPLGPHGQHGHHGPFGPHGHHHHHGGKGKHCPFGGPGPNHPAASEDFSRFGRRGFEGFEEGRGRHGDAAPFWEHMMSRRGGGCPRGGRGPQRGPTPPWEEFSRMSMGGGGRAHREMSGCPPFMGARGGWHGGRGRHHEGFPSRPEPEFCRRGHWRHSFIY